MELVVLLEVLPGILAMSWSLARRSGFLALSSPCLSSFLTLPPAPSDSSDVAFTVNFAPAGVH